MHFKETLESTIEIHAWTSLTQIHTLVTTEPLVIVMVVVWFPETETGVITFLNNILRRTSSNNILTVRWCYAGFFQYAIVFMCMVAFSFLDQ